ncbi:MAG TPA: hypothetical protein VFE58_06070 [Tepidisphaeraceae bacterium]|jgi:hypothetical protein|nr:hypothetical protein [Tepidisphaeraceae bacterium]
MNRIVGIVLLLMAMALNVSYYSSLPGKGNIYFARVRVADGGSN